MTSKNPWAASTKPQPKPRPVVVHWAGTTREQAQCGSSSYRTTKDPASVNCSKCHAEPSFPVNK